MKPSNKEQQVPVAAAPQRNYLTYVFNAWIFLPVIMLFKTISEYSVNIPYIDDYPAILKFLSDYKRANFSQKMSLFFEQYNEHRTAYSKLVYLVYYKLFGDVNFIDLIIINNLHWVGAFIVMIYFIKKYVPERWNIAAFITALAMFDVNNYENSNAAMFGMVNYGVVLFFLLSLFFYEKANKKYLPFAVLCQAICIFSSGGGLIASIALIIYTVLQKNRINMITCIAATVVFCGLYFATYVKPPSSTGASDLMTKVTFFLHLTGAHFGYIYGVAFGVMVLGALVVVLPINKKLQFPPAALPFIAILAFAFASILATAVLRSSFKMLDSYSSRYFIYPHLIISIIFIFMLVKIEGKKIQWPLTIGFILIMLYTYKENYDYGISNFELEKNRLEYSDYYWPFPDKDTPKNIAAQACQDEIYCIENER